MRLIPILFLFSLISSIITSCSSGEKKAVSETVVIEEKASIEKRHEGFTTIKELTDSFVNSIKNNNYDEYISHVMNHNEEYDQAKKIIDEKLRHAFLDEFNFSLKEEEVEFKNMVKYLVDKNVDLHKLHHEQLIELDYQEGKFAPVQLKEIIVPIMHDNLELDLVYVVIKINEKWFLTSELLI